MFQAGYFLSFNSKVCSYIERFISAYLTYLAPDASLHYKQQQIKKQIKYSIRDIIPDIFIPDNRDTDISWSIDNKLLNNHNLLDIVENRERAFY